MVVDMEGKALGSLVEEGIIGDIFCEIRKKHMVAPFPSQIRKAKWAGHILAESPTLHNKLGWEILGNHLKNAL